MRVGKRLMVSECKEQHASLPTHRRLHGEVQLQLHALAALAGFVVIIIIVVVIIFRSKGRQVHPFPNVDGALQTG